MKPKKATQKSVAFFSYLNKTANILIMKNENSTDNAFLLQKNGEIKG